MGIALDDLISSSRKFPEGLRADLQIAVNKHFENNKQVKKIIGLHEGYYYETVTFSALLQKSQSSIQLAPLQYEDVEIGEINPVRCLRNGLWLLKKENLNYVFTVPEY